MAEKSNIFIIIITIQSIFLNYAKTCCSFCSKHKLLFQRGRPKKPEFYHEETFEEEEEYFDAPPQQQPQPQQQQQQRQQQQLQHLEQRPVGQGPMFINFFDPVVNKCS